jgi:hypothetical protein
MALAERYLKADLHIGLSCRVYPQGFPIDFCAVFKRELTVGSVKGERRKHDLFAPRHWRRHAHTEHDTWIGRAYRDEPTVFVADIELMQSPKRLARLTHSLVWLQPLKQGDDGGLGSLYLCEKTGFKVRDLRPDWKLRSTMGLAASQIVHEQIQGRPEVMNQIPNDGTPCWRHFLSDFDPVRKRSVRGPA